jgi:hypothetical protein
MNSIIVTPKNSKEFYLIQELLDTMNIANKVLTLEQKEDFGLLLLMNKSDRNKKVSRATVMKKLKQ